MYLRKISLSVLDIKEKDVIYRNENVHIPVKAAKLFLPHRTGGAVMLLSRLLSGMHIAKERKNYAAPLSITAYTSPVHGRSASIPVRFHDNYGNKYNWLNFKGIGRTGSSGFKKRITIKMPFSKREIREDDFGLLTLGHANRDCTIANKLLELGMRTSPILYIIELRQLPGKDGKMHPVEELIPKSKNLEDTPVVIVRGMRNFLRLWDVYEADSRDRDLLIKKAIEYVNREGKATIRDRREYLSWLSSTVGEQLSILYSVGAYHKYINGHNITLAGEILDLGSVASHKLIEGDMKVSLTDIWKDVQNAYWELHDLVELLSLDDEKETALGRFLRRYLECAAEKSFSRAEAAELKDGIADFCNRLPLKYVKNSISDDGIHQKSLDLAWGLLVAINGGYHEAKRFLEGNAKKETMTFMRANTKHAAHGQ